MDAKVTIAEPPPPPYDKQGVDISLIHWMLSLSPRERLQVLQRQADALSRLRRATPKR